MTGSPTTEPQPADEAAEPDVGTFSPAGVELVAAVTSLPATMTRPVSFDFEPDDRPLRRLYSDEALVAAESRGREDGWRNAVAALQPLIDAAKAWREYVLIDAPFVTLDEINAEALTERKLVAAIDALESTGG